MARERGKPLSSEAPQPSVLLPAAACTLQTLRPEDKQKVASLLQQVVDLGQEVRTLKTEVKSTCLNSSFSCRPARYQQLHAIIVHTAPTAGQGSERDQPAAHPGERQPQGENGTNADNNEGLSAQGALPPEFGVQMA